MPRSFESVGKTSPVGEVYATKIKFGKKPMLHVVDASNWMARAFFATQNAEPYARGPDGTPTGGLNQFLSMAQTLIDTISKDPNGCFIAFCFDPSSKETWRHRAMSQFASENKKSYMKKVFRLSHDYKGNRDRTKSLDLPVQMALAREILQRAGYWVGLKAPYEADDLVGTIVYRFCPDYLIKMYSRDKDYVQLVFNKNVELIMQRQSNSKEQRYDHKTAKNFFGVPADRVRDMLALSGDAVDNVPGYSGMGEKTARDLINQYGSALELQQAVISGKCKSKAAWAKQLRGELPHMPLDLQLELVTIDLNVPKLPKTIEGFAPRKSDDKALRKFKKELGLSRLLHL
ncbi:putative DNA polymerase I [Erwinia phage pEa_SNUABM_5]|uniref:Putative DNA polymerase I n=1 Tax=Erwinia phage pEa_SNUABM_5 TaxID=2797313 RepID=A0A7T8IVL0_9CAUD|nr:putative DNA polymerase I [Erwinia phage pEa_SNUABM_5]QQO90151.1 putative DNA polymerase I [Erwinia phage pEa_SNUABM_5]